MLQTNIDIEKINGRSNKIFQMRMASIRRLSRQSWTLRHWANVVNLMCTGRQAHVMTFEVGAALEDAKWQAPVYCFDKKEKSLVDATTATLTASVLRSEEYAFVN